MDRLARWLAPTFQWAQANPGVLAWAFSLSLVLFVGSLVVMPVLIARLRADYFIREISHDTWRQRHPAAWLTGMVLKNTLGVVLFLAGLAMMVLPGQGVITILVALSLLDFPGKRQLELRIVQKRRIRDVIAWIRARAGSPPLRFPENGHP